MASTQLITDLNTCYTTGPTATSQANSINPANAILDIYGILYSAIVALKGLKYNLNTYVYADLDSVQPDPIRATLLGVIQSLV